MLIQPKECLDIKDRWKNNVDVPNKIRSLTFWFAIKLIIFVNLAAYIGMIAFYIIYKLKLRREFEVRKDQEIDSALSNYYMENRVEMNTGPKDDDDDDYD